MKTATKIAVALLALVAIGHLLRLLFGLEVVIGGWAAPMWASVIGTLVPGALAYLVYREH